MKIKKLLSCIIILTLILLCGCSSQNIYLDYREIDLLELIQTIGFDYENEKITATIASGITRESPTPTILYESADTATLALKKLQNYTEPKYIFFSHMENILIGKEAAEHSFGELLDFVQRTVDMRLDASLFILTEGNAKDAILNTAGDKAAINELLNSLKKDVTLLSEGHVFSFGDIASSLAYNGCAIVSAIETVPKKEPLETGSNFTVASSGYAIIKEGKLAGFINTDCAKGVNLLTNQMKTDFLEIDDGKGGYISLKLIFDNTTVTPIYDGNVLECVDISVKLHAQIEELQNPIDIYDPGTLSSFEEKLSQKEKIFIQAAINASQSMAADFMQFEKIIHIKNPIKFEKIQNSWADIFPDLKFNISVSSTIDRTYDIGGHLQASERE